MPPRLAPKGDITSRGVLSVVFKIPKCTSHLGIGLVRMLEHMATGEDQEGRLVAFHFSSWLNGSLENEKLG